MTNLERLRDGMKANGTSAMLVSDPTNVRWLTGFTGSSGYAIVLQDQARFLTDSRYTIQAREEVKDLDVKWFQNPKRLVDFVKENLTEMGVASLAVETSMTYKAYTDWGRELSGVELVPDQGTIEPLRMVKSSTEIDIIRRACKLADKCIEHVMPHLQPGVVEADIGIEIEFFFRRHGAEVGFSPIVASGPNSARPHARPSERKFEPGDFVTLDLGARLDGYCSDITRTFVIGKASEKHKEVYEAVLRAQLAAIDAVRPGAMAKDVDGAARDSLANVGLAEHFGHGLGHGLGMAVHDFGGLSPTSSNVIAPGQVWTIEPGVYIEGFGGVRIEDDVVVTDGGCEILTHFPKGLQELA